MKRSQSRFLSFPAELLAAKSSSFAQFSGATISRRKPPGSKKKTSAETTQTFLLTNLNLEGEIHLKGGRFVTSQFSIWMLYIDHHMHIIFDFAFGCDPRNLKELKDPRRELEVSQKSNFDLSKFGKLDQIVFQNSFPIILNKERR